MTAQAPRSKIPTLIGLALGVPFLVGLVALFGYASCETGGVNGEVEAYVQRLRDDKLDEAYARVHPDTQARVDRAAFETSMFTPELREAGSMTFQETYTYGSLGRACVDGHVDLPAGNRGLRVYLLETDDGFRILDVLIYDGVVPRGPFACGGV